jgi:hypothetical protein
MDSWYKIYVGQDPDPDNWEIINGQFTVGTKFMSDRSRILTTGK